MNDRTTVTRSAPPQGSEWISLLEAQLELFQRLGRLAVRQSRMVSQGDTRPLLEILVQRRHLTTELVEISKRLQPWQENWDQVRKRLEEPERLRVEKVIRAVSERLGDILRHDELDAQILASRKISKGESLNALNTGARAAGAYAKSVGSFPQEPTRLAAKS